MGAPEHEGTAREAAEESRSAEADAPGGVPVQRTDSPDAVAGAGEDRPLPQAPAGPEATEATEAAAADTVVADRTRVQALMARVRASRAEYAADVHALTEGLERYVRGHLLAEDSELGRLRQRAERAERERDELARQLWEEQEARARVVAALQHVREAIDELPDALPAPDGAVPLLPPDASEVAADAD